MPTILLLDPGWSQSPYLIVELRRVGFDVVRACPGVVDTLGIGGYCEQISAPDDFDDTFLRRVLRDVRADIVLPLMESVMMRLWSYPPELTARVYPATSEMQRALLVDRRAMYAFATSVGVPIPPMRALDTPGALADAVAAFGFPMVLRGTQGLGGVQVRIVHDQAAADAAFAALRAVSPAPPFAQQLIHGRRCLIGSLLDRGVMRQWFSQTTIEADSPPTGPSIRVRSLVSPTLTSYAERLFGGLGWTGLACAEFIQDDAGEFHFMEINPRPWAAIRAAHVCGLPLLRSFARVLRDPNAPLAASAFATDRDVALFPQYVASMLRARKRGARVGSAAQLLSCLSHAPWQHPRLMLHFARTIRWQLS